MTVATNLNSGRWWLFDAPPFMPTVICRKLQLYVNLCQKSWALVGKRRQGSRWRSCFLCISSISKGGRVVLLSISSIPKSGRIFFIYLKRWKSSFFYLFHLFKRWESFFYLFDLFQRWKSCQSPTRWWPALRLVTSKTWWWLRWEWEWDENIFEEVNSTISGTTSVLQPVQQLIPGFRSSLTH